MHNLSQLRLSSWNFSVTDQPMASNGSISRSQNSALLKAAGLVVFCMTILGLIDNFVRLVGQEIGVWQFHMVRSVIICSTIYLVAKVAGWSVRPVHAGRVLLRTVAVASSMVLYFAAIGFIPVAKAAAGLFTAPIFMLIFSVVLFKQKIGPVRIVAVAIGFAGVVMVLRPFQGDIDPMIFVSVIAGVFYALGLLITREYCSDEPTAAIVLWFFGGLGVMGTIGVIVTSFLSIAPEEATFLTRSWVWPSLRNLAILVAISLAAMVAMSSQTLGYQMADASLLSVFEYSFLVFAGIWGLVLWGETFTLLDIFGMGLIAVAGIIISLRR